MQPGCRDSQWPSDMHEPCAGLRLPGSVHTADAEGRVAPLHIRMVDGAREDVCISAAHIHGTASEHSGCVSEISKWRATLRGVSLDSEEEGASSRGTLPRPSARTRG
jgi:hypothetical protein